MRALRVALLAGLIGLTQAAAAWAGTITLAWNASTGPNVAGYVINWRSANGSHTGNTDVGLVLTAAISGLTNGTTYYFTAVAYNGSGLFSGTSNEVSAMVPGTPPPPPPTCTYSVSPVSQSVAAAGGTGQVTVGASASSCAWTAASGAGWLTITAGASGTGAGQVTFSAAANSSTTARSTSVTVAGSVATVTQAGAAPPPPPGAVTTYFAEGVTGIFNVDFALVNTTSAATTVNLSLLPQGAPVATRQVSVPARARATFSANSVTELNGIPFGVAVAAIPGVYAERTLSWSVAGEVGATTAKSITGPATRWYLAEGNAGYFDTFILMANANASAVTATLDFLLDDGVTVTRQYSIPGNQRLTVYANQVPGLVNRSFGTTVNSTAPILVERAMYFTGPAAFWRDGHASAAVASGARQWFLAEGRTGTWFDTFVLLSNPNTSAVTATIRYLTPAGLARTETRTLPPTSRTTILVDTVPGLADTDVSCDISSSADIIVERSMYWPGSPGPWYGAHNSVGLTSLGVEWAFAEGQVGGNPGAQTFILLANPGTVTANVTLTFFRTSGGPLTTTRQVGPGGRLTVDASSVGLAAGERFGGSVVSDQPIAVERSIYWTANTLWAAGTNETAFKVR